MTQYALVRNDRPLPDEPYGDERLEDRVRRLEAQLRELEQNVSGWQDQTAGVFEVAQQLRSQLKSAKEQSALNSTTPDIEINPSTETEESIVVQAQPTPTPVTSAGGSSWLVLDILSDIKDMATMVFDARYKRSWTVALVVPLLIAMFVMSWLFFSVPVVSQGVELVMALMLFKVMNRELVRYRTHLQRIGAR